MENQKTAMEIYLKKPPKSKNNERNQILRAKNLFPIYSNRNPFSIRLLKRKLIHGLSNISLFTKTKEEIEKFDATFIQPKMYFLYFTYNLKRNLTKKKDFTKNEI